MVSQLRLIDSGQTYHVYNKCLPPFDELIQKNNAQRILNLLRYHLSGEDKPCYSDFLKLSLERKERILSHKNNRITILAYCIMPTHYHLLIKQNSDNGISEYISAVQDSITKYINAVKQRNGPLFISRYKSVCIVTEPQFIHTYRYIHLNPYSSKLVTSFTQLQRYRYSSYYEYIHSRTLLCDTDAMKIYLHPKTKFISFHEDHADYQRGLEYCKY